MFNNYKILKSLLEENKQNKCLYQKMAEQNENIKSIINRINNIEANLAQENFSSWLGNYQNRWLGYSAVLNIPHSCQMRENKMSNETKVKFNHDEDSFFKIFLISPERKDEIIDFGNKVIYKLLSEQDYSDSHAIEEMCNFANDKIEAAMIGYVTCRNISKLIAAKEKEHGQSTNV